MSFVSLGLHPVILQAITALSYRSPTPIQQQAIPIILQKRDVMAGAQTGTGKTAAFALPLLTQLANDVSFLPSGSVSPRVLVLTPTRELAQQVHKSFTEYAQFSTIKCVLLHGGTSLNRQIAALNSGVDVLVATPGRLLECLFKHIVDLMEVQALVFDEADRMLDMGFMVEVDRILSRLPEARQTLLFSATFNDQVFALSKRLLRQPVLIEVGERNQAAVKVEQRVYAIDAARKRELISYLIGSKNWHNVLIFTRTKQGADLLSAEMQKDGIQVQSIHGDKSQGARDKILSEFRQGQLRALVATDVAARGLDIPEIAQVFNYELPYNAEDYIHRIGRTGRAGKSGLAISLVSPKEQYLLTSVEQVLGESLPQQWFPGYEPSLDVVESQVKRHKPGNIKKRARDKAIAESKLKKR